jgi:hypothetical protein
VDEKKPSKIPRVIRHWWPLPVFLALLGWEAYTVSQGTPPNWFWVAIAVLGLGFVVLVNVKGYRE